MYPYIQKYGKFPIGHPEILTENIQNIENYFGIIYCRVLPPGKLYLPVLPYHSNGKFPLCATCANEHLLTNCNHSDEERCLESTWVSLELNAALIVGYKVVKVFEVWHWNVTEQYNSTTQGG